MTGNSIRKILVHADQMEALFETEWGKTICQTMAHLGKIQIFTKAQLLSPGDLDGLETAVDQFKAFLDEQPMVRTLLSKKTKAHLLFHHFVPFARQHQFLGLLDEQGDEALHSLWRRLEQLWKTMPDAEQMRQQLEHHFVSNWLMDTGRLDELKLREEERREQAAGDKTNEESDQDVDIDVTFLRATASVSYQVHFHFDMPTSIGPFEFALMNERTNEKLTLTKDGSVCWVLKRCPINGEMEAVQQQKDEQSDANLNIVHFTLKSCNNCFGPLSPPAGKEEADKAMRKCARRLPGPVISSGMMSDHLNKLSSDE
ncbi:hypothetical protein niasHS_016267 [Heterodera schachtii]|uniref:Uncharacterized protein n=1 Tax=Heterodera schachtii TaxID=97005 RepID=A0ABD2HN68_HETSC